jgi:hypothetical protein
MSWKTFLREIDRAGRRRERASLQRHRQLVRQAKLTQRTRIGEHKAMAKAEKEAARAAEREAAAEEVALFENYLEILTSVHKDLVLERDWMAVLSLPAPQVPEPVRTRQRVAGAKLASYEPGLLERAFGRAAKTRAQMENELEDAIAADSREEAEAAAAYDLALREHSEHAALARGVLGQDLGSYKEALRALAELDDFEAMGSQVRVDAVQVDAVALSCEVRDVEIVPSEEVKTTAAGKLSSKKMADGKYWGLYQDFVCGSALRLARESFGLLPITRVAVNVRTPVLNPSTGHTELATILAVQISRTAIGGLNFAAVDASESMKNFEARMKFKKTTGFEPVEPMNLSEMWLS